MSDFTTWRSLVDGEEISLIPDSGLLHDYNPASLNLSHGDSLSEWSDDEGDVNLTVEAGSPTYEQDGRDHPAVVMDGDSFSSDHDVGQPVGLFFVLEPFGQSNESFIRLFSDGSASAGSKVQFRPDVSDIRYGFGESNTFSASYTEDKQLLSLIGDGTDGQLRRDGETLNQSDVGSNNWSPERLFARDGGGETFNADVLRILVYNLDESDGIETIEDAINDQYGVY